MFRKLIASLFYPLLIFAFLLSGMGQDVQNISHVTVFCAIAVGFTFILSGKVKLRIPKYFIYFLIFTSILQIYWLFVAGKLAPFYYSILFVEATCLWFIVYNFDEAYSRFLSSLLVIPAFIYGFIYFFSKLNNNSLIKLASIFFIPNPGSSHSQIGNFAAVVLIYLIGSSFIRKRFTYDLILFLFEIYFVILSKSRTSYLALISTLILTFYNRSHLKKNLLIVVLLLGFSIALVGITRTTFFSRPYFSQSILAFAKYPFGVGMGNFRIISENFYYKGGPLGFYSDVTHNIFLEAVSGVGIFSIPFILWGVVTFFGVVKNLNTKNLAWSGVFISLFVIFFFDYTYLILGMFWLWIISLAMSQKNIEAN